MSTKGKTPFRTIGLTLTLALVPGLVAAQRTKPQGDPGSPVSSCTASPVVCFWGGIVGGCSASCVVGSPHCESGTCQFGFPASSSHCWCE
jgi:hypothetical protein